MRRLLDSRRVALAVAAVLAFGSARGALAQQQMAFVHGFRSDGGDWAGLPINLINRFPLYAITPTLGWDRRLASQAITLSDVMSAYGFDGSAVAFGHSNGGLISREMSRLRPVRGVVTVGTLHTGAPLAGNLGGVAVLSDVTFITNILPYLYFHWLVWCYDCYTDSFSWWITYYAMYYDLNMAYVGGLAYLATQYVGFTSSDVLPDMTPGSAFLQSLNSWTNLVREQYDVPIRVGIGSQTWDNFGIMWQGVLADYAPQLTNLQYTAAFLSYIAFFVNAFYQDPYYDPYFWDKWFGSWFFLQAAYVDWSIDPWWCQLIGAWDGWCTPSDGIVPLDRQWFPSAGARGYLITGPSHTQEKGSWQLFEAASLTLQHDFGLPPRY